MTSINVVVILFTNLGQKKKIFVSSYIWQNKLAIHIQTPVIISVPCLVLSWSKEVASQRKMPEVTLDPRCIFWVIIACC